MARDEVLLQFKFYYSLIFVSYGKMENKSDH